MRPGDSQGYWGMPYRSFEDSRGDLQHWAVKIFSFVAILGSAICSDRFRFQGKWVLIRMVDTFLGNYQLFAKCAFNEQLPLICCPDIGLLWLPVGSTDTFFSDVALPTVPCLCLLSVWRLSCLPFLLPLMALRTEASRARTYIVIVY